MQSVSINSQEIITIDGLHYKQTGARFWSFNTEPYWGDGFYHQTAVIEWAVLLPPGVYAEDGTGRMIVTTFTWQAAIDAGYLELVAPVKRK